MNKENTDIVESYPHMFTSCFDFSTGAGWSKIVREMVRQLSELKDDSAHIHQIKSKFAGLRCYCAGHNDKIESIIGKAEYDCYRTCEDCGESGAQNDVRKWLWTLCDPCYKRHLEMSSRND